MRRGTLRVVALVALLPALAACGTGSGPRPHATGPGVINGTFTRDSGAAVPDYDDADFSDLGGVDGILRDSVAVICGRYVPLPPDGRFEDFIYDKEDSPLLHDFDSIFFTRGTDADGGPTSSLTMASFDFVSDREAQAGYDRFVAATHVCNGAPDQDGTVETVDAYRPLPVIEVPRLIESSSFDGRTAYPQGGFSTTCGVVLVGHVMTYVRADAPGPDEAHELARRGWTWVADHLSRGR